MNVRCKYCNWMNLEVQNQYICKNCKKENIVDKAEKMIDKIVEEIVKEDWTTALEDIKGIGAETTLDIGRMYSSLEELKKDLRDNKVALRNDVVQKLKLNLI